MTSNDFQFAGRTFAEAELLEWAEDLSDADKEILKYLKDGRQIFRKELQTQMFEKAKAGVSIHPITKDDFTEYKSGGAWSAELVEEIDCLIRDILIFDEEIQYVAGGKKMQNLKISELGLKVLSYVKTEE